MAAECTNCDDDGLCPECEGDGCETCGETGDCQECTSDLEVAVDDDDDEEVDDDGFDEDWDDA